MRLGGTQEQPLYIVIASRPCGVAIHAPAKAFVRARDGLLRRKRYSQ
jgi:hypothetical protein